MPTSGRLCSTTSQPNFSKTLCDPFAQKHSLRSYVHHLAVSAVCTTDTCALGTASRKWICASCAHDTKYFLPTNRVSHSVEEVASERSSFFSTTVALHSRARLQLIVVQRGMACCARIGICRKLWTLHREKCSVCYVRALIWVSDRIQVHSVISSETSFPWKYALCSVRALDHSTTAHNRRQRRCPSTIVKIAREPGGVDFVRMTIS